VLRRLSEGAWHVGGKARSSDFRAEGGGLGSEDETLGFSFSASGLMMPFHHGVGVALRDAGVLTRSTPLGGSSGGAIAAAALACELPKEEVNEGIVAVAEDCRSYGSFRRMLIPAKKLCDQVLPEDSHHRMNGQVHVSVMEILPRLRPLVVNEWTSKDDVVESLIASSNIPFVLGPTPLAMFRNTSCIDGSFATPIGSFGCVDIPGARTIRVMAFEPKRFGRLSKMVHANPQDAIAPGLRVGDGCDTYTLRKLLRFAAGSPPPNEVEVERLFNMGYRCAELWLEEEKSRLSRVL